MKKILLTMILYSTLLYVVTIAVPISISLSNVQSSVGIQATPLNLSVGYPESFAEFGNLPYLRVDFQEATPVVGIEANYEFYGNQNLGFSVGGRSDFGELAGRTNDGKILEVGRLFLTLEGYMDLQNLQLSARYLRFYSSFNYNASENMVFLAPPNYLGHSPNALRLFASYTFDWFKDVNFSLFARSELDFSDGFVFSSPSLEMGFSFGMTTETLQSIFKTN